MKWFGGNFSITVNREYHRATGWRIVVIYQGSMDALIYYEGLAKLRAVNYKTFFETLPARLEEYYDYLYDPQNPPAPSLIDQPTYTFWGIDGEWDQKSVWEHPKVVAAFLALTPDAASAAWLRMQIVNYLASGDPFQTTSGTANQSPANLPSPVDLSSILSAPTTNISYANIAELVARLARDDKTWEAPRYAIHYRQLYSWNASWGAATINWDIGGSLISTENLRSEYPAMTIEPPPGLYWLQHPPRYEQLSNSQLQLTMDWTEETYDDWKYSIFIPS